MVIGKALGAYLRGTEAVPIEVQVAVEEGLPGIAILGVADNLAIAMRAHIRCALKNVGFSLPRKHITIDFSGERVDDGAGSVLSLAAAVAFLDATGQIPHDAVEGSLFIGDLGLSGEIKPSRNAVSYGLLARELYLRLVGNLPKETNDIQCDTYTLTNLDQLLGKR